MYRTIVAVYSSLPDARVLRRELEDSGVPPSQIHISTEEAAAATGLPAHEPGGFTDWLLGVPEEDLSFFQESLDAGRALVKVHVAEDLYEKVSQLLNRFGPITVDSAKDETVQEGPVVPVRSYIVELPFEDLVRQREELARAKRSVRQKTAAPAAEEPETVGSESGAAPRVRR